MHDHELSIAVLEENVDRLQRKADRHAQKHDALCLAFGISPEYGYGAVGAGTIQQEMLREEWAKAMAYTEEAETLRHSILALHDDMNRKAAHA